MEKYAMDKKIFVINGTGGSGKDTFVNFISKYAKVFNTSSVDKVKEIASYCGWNGKKEEKDRKFLSDLKALLTNYNDYPFHDIMKKIDYFYQSNDEIMFIHIREPEEILKVVEASGAKTILIKRKNLNNINSNTSDMNVDNYNYDYYINNDSTLEDFEEKAKEFLENIKTKKL